MGDETDHQSVRRLSQDGKIATTVIEGDHAQVVAMSESKDGNKGGGSSSGSPQPPKEWVKFEEDAAKDNKSLSPGKSNNKSSQVSQIRVLRLNSHFLSASVPQQTEFLSAYEDILSGWFTWAITT